MTDEQIASRESDYFTEADFPIIIRGDADVVDENDRLLLRFRKNVISKELTDLAVASYTKASKSLHENRGASAGALDRKKLANYIGEFINPGKFRTKFKSGTTGIESKQATSNLSPSNIIGYFDKHDRNLKTKGAPCRLTAFNRDHPELWETALPFLKRCDELFKELIPDRHELQRNQAAETPDFIIPETAFSTVTINYSWRTGLHKDAGDYRPGYGNLIVIEDHNNPNSYTGGYTGFPQFGVAVDVRTGDFLAMDVHEWHCNTEMFLVGNNQIQGNYTQREIDNKWYFNRLSVVCYLREKMIRCKGLQTDKVQLMHLDKKPKTKRKTNIDKTKDVDPTVVKPKMVYKKKTVIELIPKTDENKD
jgi:hypothetical protein